MDIKNRFDMNTLRSLAIGIAAALIFTVILSFAAGTILYISPLPDNDLLMYAVGIEAFSMLAAGAVTARLHGSRGLIMGTVCGITVWLILLICGTEGVSPLLSLACCTVPGAAGGLLGRA